MFKAQRPVSARALSLVLCSAVILCLSVPVFCETLLAKSILYRSQGQQLSDGTVVLTKNSYLGSYVQLTSPGPVTFTINASAQSAGGIGPLMHLHVGDSKATWSVSDGAFADYTTTLNLPAGTFALRLEFTNQGTVNSVTRSLSVKSLALSGASASFQNYDSEDNALAAADSYVLNYRRGLATVTVLDAQGNPVPAEVAVRAKSKKLAFNFGTCVPGATTDLWFADPAPAPGSDADHFQKFVDSHFTMITPEACGKWAYQEATRNSVVMTYIDQYLDYAERHGLRARMHCLLWDNEMSEPAWVNDLETRAAAGDTAAKDDLRAAISSRIQYYVTPRAGRYTELDCVNETKSNPIFTTIYGFSGVAGIYNETVAASAGRARAYVNELNVDNDNYYAEWYRSHIQSIMDAGGTVQGIGRQGNLQSSGRTPARVIHRNLQNLDVFELPISTTEYRVALGGDTVTVLNNMMRLMYGNDMATSFLMWGFWRNAIYSSGLEVLVNADWSLTACGVEYERLMAQWSTDTSQMTDANGRVQFTGYYGDYDVTINGKTYPLKLAKGTTSYQIAQTPMVIDTFDRPDSSNLGLTEDPNHHPWAKSYSESAASISGGRLLLGGAAANGSGVGVGGSYLPADFDMKLTLSIVGSGSDWAGIAYRQSLVGESAQGYALRFPASGASAQLQLPNSVLVSTDIQPPIDWSVPQCVHVKITSNHHEAWVGFRKVFDYFDSQKLTGGYLNLVRTNCAAAFDNLAVVEGETLPLVNASSSRQAKTQSDNTFIELAAPIVTRTFPGYFYVEDVSRVSGIRVVTPRPVSPGDAVVISGIVGTDSGEKVIKGWDIQSLSSNNSVTPLGLTNLALGQGAVWSGAPGVPALGADNIGICVRVYGQVTQIDPSGSYFYIDDGSGLTDATSTQGQPNRGVRVAFDGGSYLESCLILTGISSCFEGPDGKPRRLLRVAGPSDIHVVQ